MKELKNLNDRALFNKDLFYEELVKSLQEFMTYHYRSNLTYDVNLRSFAGLLDYDYDKNSKFTRAIDDRLLLESKKDDARNQEIANYLKEQIQEYDITKEWIDEENAKGGNLELIRFVQSTYKKD